MNSQREHFVSVMLSMVQEAGLIALDYIETSCPDLKPDGSVITRADLAISALAHRTLAPLLASGQHALIDEEDPKRGEYCKDHFLEDHPYLWAIDPIDATRAYANRMPHYGISVGLMKNRYPWLGAVYFPSLKELFYCDGDQAYFVRSAFTEGEQKTLIVPLDAEVSRQSIFIASDEILTSFQWVPDECRIMIFAAAVCEFCWPVIGRGVGSLSKVHLWDMAGAWPIFERAGLKMRTYSDGKPLDCVHTSLFDHKDAPWKFKDYYILSSERNYAVFRKSIVPVARESLQHDT